MRIVDAGYEILDPLNGEEILKKIERVARVCYKNVQAFNVVTLWIVAIVLIIKLVTM